MKRISCGRVVCTALVMGLLWGAGCGAPVQDVSSMNQTSAREDVDPARRHHALAQQYFKNGDYDAAVAQYKKGLAMDPASIGMMRGLAETFMKLAARKKETLKVQGASPDTSQVVKSYYDQAVKVYDGAMEFEPDNVEIKEGRAYVLNAAMRYDEAVVVYRDILSSKPDDAGVWVNLGYTYSKKGDTDSAVEAYSRAVDLDPDDRDTVLRAARMLYDGGREAESLPWFKRAYLMDSSDSTLGKFLGALYIRDKDYENAVPIYEVLVAEEPEDWRLQINYGVALEKTDAMDEALLVYHEVLLLNPEKVEVYFQAADLLMDMSRYAEALDYAKRGLAVNPDMANGYASKGKALEKLGTELQAAKKFDAAQTRFEEAKTTFQKGLALNDPRLNDYFNKQISRQDQLIARNEAQADADQYGYN